MLIGRLSKLTGVSRDTIRFYEKIGLIKMPRRAPGVAYKDYPQEIVELLRAIQQFKEFGFTLKEIRELLELRSLQVIDLKDLVRVVERRLNWVDEELQKLNAFRARLEEEHDLLINHKKSRLIDLPQMRMAA